MITLIEFCEKILFSDNLMSKLEDADKIDFKVCSTLKSIPGLPSRPAELAFSNDKTVKLPSIKDLEDKRQRGILLHFFLNHELLALELMALMLLRFPDAPESFKRGLVKTIKDEQMHAKSYVELMQNFGVEVGDVPINKFFWDALSRSENLKKFVAGMSLTFEQANLDFSLFYKDAFETVGDFQTASVLQEVYDDELAHVCHGLSWFRRWKSKGLSDWQEYAQILDIPLSPSRGKGPLFDLEGRQKAGFDREFIDNMKVTSQSRGRSPDVFIFHGFAEVSITKGKAFNFPRWGEQLERDLSLLPLIFCRQDDLLLTWEHVSVEHLQKLQNMGLTLPEVSHCEFYKPVKALAKRHAGSLQPWGWSPYIDQTLQALVNQNDRLTGWDSSFKELFTKVFAVKLSKDFQKEGLHSWFTDSDFETDLCKTCHEVTESVSKFFKDGWKSVVVKAPFGASGRNMFRIFDGQISKEQISQVTAFFNDFDVLLVEPWVERVLDFSLHFDLSESVRYKGVTRMVNDERGQYNASFFGAPFRGLDEGLLKTLHSSSPKGINGYGEFFAQALSKKLCREKYKGPIGIDCLIFKNRVGELKVRPLVEMNFRYTMGRVALGFESYLKPGRMGMLKIISLKSKNQAYMKNRVEKLSHETITLTDKGLWDNGVFLLNEQNKKLNFPILITIGRNEKECNEFIEL